ncbi:MAG: endonuclease MutS2 [Firmicutes bacterium]|nr:endonuclease MutS2 [Bacillota bacterium]
MLAERAITDRGRRKAMDVAPCTERGQASRALAETTEAAAILETKSPPLRGIRDIAAVVKRCELGGTAGPGELVDVAATASVTSDLKRFLSQVTQPGSPLHSRAARLCNLRDLSLSIMECLTDEAEVRDDASPELKRIRSQMRNLAAKVRERLDSMTRSPDMVRLLQEPIVTLRAGRYVIPVRQEHKALVPGVVHDQSASGATLFVEPMAVVEMNNDIRRLEMAERDEIERILRDLSARVSERADELLETIEAAAWIDFAFAKGRLSIDMEASEPVLGSGWVIDLKRARHPLLHGDVVPVDVHLGRSFDTLVITGPNTGGKTVTLKTVGLLTLMAHAGLHLPAGYGSVISLFNGVFCDVGDEQSIEQSLSTFSSHMSHIVEIIRKAGEGSLVLLDELGAGTDPAEGSALAMAILEHLHSAGARTIATTHYSELKSFAFTRDRVENASVEFDVETLRPTYRLTIGLPGRSNAFEIAARLGLDGSIIDKARGFVGREGLRVEDMIAEIERVKRAAEEDQRAAEAARRAVVKLKEEYSRRLQDLRTRENAILQKAQADALAVVQKAKARAREAMDRLKEAERISSREREALVQQARDALREAAQEARAPGGLDDALDGAPGTGTTAPYDGPSLDSVKPGDSVFVRSIGQVGRVLDKPGPSGDVLVQIGILKIQVNVHDLVAAPGAEPGAAPGETLPAQRSADGIVRVMSDKAREVSPEIDLRGMTVDEALMAVDKYLDDALLGGVPQVRIIHGKGTGALRSAVREFLRHHPHVASFRFGAQGEGGDGVSVASLK